MVSRMIELPMLESQSVVHNGRLVTSRLLHSKQVISTTYTQTFCLISTLTTTKNALQNIRTIKYRF